MSFPFIEKLYSANKKELNKFNGKIDRFVKARGVFCKGIIGHNGTGKSVTAEELARYWREANPLIVDKDGKITSGEIWAHDPTKRFQDVLTREIYPHNNWMEEALELRNGLLILDELRILHPSAITNKKFLELLAMRREYCIDIIYIVHNPSLVLETLTYYTTHYYLFYTQAKVGNFEKRMPNYLLCQAASNYINKYVRKFGKGEYPVFPFLTIENETEEITGYNIDINKLKKLE